MDRRPHPKLSAPGLLPLWLLLFLIGPASYLWYAASGDASVLYDQIALVAAWLALFHFVIRHKQRRLLKHGIPCRGEIVENAYHASGKSGFCARFRVRYTVNGKTHEEWSPTYFAGFGFYSPEPKGGPVALFVDPENPYVFAIYDFCDYRLADEAMLSTL